MKHRLLLTAVVAIMALHFSEVKAQAPIAGEESGFFGIGRNTKARFSQGNLQYQASTGTWRFAEHQYDTIGADNANISSTYSGWIDLFGWGTSGWNSGAVCYQPWATSTRDSDYYPGGAYTNNLTGSYANADWGVYNVISNGGNAAGLWRTLTKDEWVYLFTTRSASTINGVSNARYAKSNVGGIAGVIMFPDIYSHPAGVALPTNINVDTANYTANNYSNADWTAMETAGAVFLPAAGYRKNSNIYHVGSICDYWSSTCHDSVNASRIFFRNDLFHIFRRTYELRSYGFSVRLVRSYPCNSASTEVMTSCDSYTWHGRTFTSSTDTATYTTTNAAGCDSVVTLHLTISHCTASSVAGEKNGFFGIGRNTKARFSQGNLQYQASTGTWRFAEHQWDYVGSQNPQHGSPGGTVTGSENRSISSTYSGWIDLFGWGTSGWNSGAVCYQPWSASRTNSDYFPGGSSTTNLTGSYARADWGVYNAISNGGNAIGLWRTLTKDEWVYLLESRSTSTLNGVSNARYVKGTVAGVAGVILFPDTYSHPVGVALPTSINVSNANYSTNNYSSTDWAAMEAARAVFLPAAGFRYGTYVEDVGSSGSYWSSFSYDTTDAVRMAFDNYVLKSSNNRYRHGGRSVRLVRSYPCNSASTEVMTSCDSYTWHGRTFTSSTDTATYTTTNAAGCDSVVTLHLTVNYSNTGTETVSACNSHTWHGRTFTASVDTATYATTNAAGCDSVTTLHLTVGRDTAVSLVCSTGQTLNYSINCANGTATCTGYSGTCAGSLSIPDSITVNGIAYSVDTIGHNAFRNCTGITALTIPNSIVSIDDDAFRGCGNVVSCVVHSSNGVYDSRNSCNAIIHTATNKLIFGCRNTVIPNTVTNIGNTSFNWCIGLTSITIPSTVTAIGQNPFRGCEDLTSIVVESGNSVYDSRNGCNAIISTTTNKLVTGCKTTVIPNNTAIIGFSAFEDCGISGSITIPNSVTTIDQYAFKNCSTLTGTLIIPSSVTSIAESAFRACSGFTAIQSLATVPPSLVSTPFSGISTAIPVGVPCGSVATYRAAAGWSSFSNIKGIYDNQATETVKACNSHTWHGRTFTASVDTATYTTTNAAGCDSVVTLHLTVGRDTAMSIDSAGCAPMMWHDTLRNASGQYVYRDTTVQGCTLTDTLHFTLYPDSSSSFTVNDTDSYTWVNHGTTATYTGSGTYTHSYTTTHGCHCTDTLHLTITNMYFVRAATANRAMGSASVDGGGNVAAGSSCTIRAHANSGYRFVRWHNGATANPYTFTVTQDTLFVAVFEARGYTIAVVNGTPGRGYVYGSGTVQHGASRTIEATPAPGYRFGHWNDGDTNAMRTVTVTCDTTFTAYFDALLFHISAVADDTAQGSVSGSGDYYYHNYATLRATPAAGYRFSHWDDGETGNPRSLLVTGNRVVRAHFASGQRLYTIAVRSNDSTMGTVEGGGHYAAGAQAVLSATPNSGYAFVAWNDGITANPRVVTVSGDALYTATFGRAQGRGYYTVTATSNDSLMGRVSGGGIFRTCTVTQLNAYPAPRCHFMRWSDGDTNNPRNLVVERDTTVMALFAHDTVMITVLANNSRWGSVEGEGLYAVGSEATITATPNRGYRFYKWRTGEFDNPLTFTVRYAATYAAVFLPTQGIDEAGDAQQHVWSSMATIHVDGLCDETVSVYDVTGRLIGQQRHATGEWTLTVRDQGVYMVQTATGVHKVVTIW